MAKQKKVKLTKLYVHEALDRSGLLSYIVEEYLYNHPVIQENSELKKKCGKAVELLADLYQDVANINTDKLK